MVHTNANVEFEAIWKAGNLLDEKDMSIIIRYILAHFKLLIDLSRTRYFVSWNKMFERLEKKRLTKIAFVSLESWPGKGVYTAKQTQLPMMVKSMKKSKGFHSTKAMQCFLKGFLRERHPIAFWARSGGGLAPIRLAGFLGSTWILLPLGGAPSRVAFHADDRLVFSRPWNETKNDKFLETIMWLFLIFKD